MSEERPLSAEEKREKLKQLLKQKGLPKRRGYRCGQFHKGNIDTARFADVNQFPEVQALAAQFKTLEALQVENPYFG